MFARDVPLMPSRGNYDRGTGGTTGATEGGAAVQLRLRGEMDKYLSVAGSSIVGNNVIDYHQAYLKTGTML